MSAEVLNTLVVGSVNWDMYTQMHSAYVLSFNKVFSGRETY